VLAGYCISFHVTTNIHEALKSKSENRLFIVTDILSSSASDVASPSDMIL
jgi:hypothetical protein